MKHFVARLQLLGLIVVLFASLAGCFRHAAIDISAETSVSGTVNGSPMEGNVLASFNTARGGSSTCTFSRLPAGFTPGTLGTHS
jgi:hypothetical protein